MSVAIGAVTPLLLFLDEVGPGYSSRRALAGRRKCWLVLSNVVPGPFGFGGVLAGPPVTLVWHGEAARKVRKDLSGFFVFGGTDRRVSRRTLSE